MDIFEAFDQLVLLQRGGRLTYFGSLGLGGWEVDSGWAVERTRGPDRGE